MIYKDTHSHSNEVEVSPLIQCCATMHILMSYVTMWRWHLSFWC